MIGCTPADVEDVVTYYVMFFTKPVGTYVLQVCRTLSCALNGAERVTEEICKHLHVRPGETDATGTFTVQEFECLGACDRAPVIMINNEHWQEHQRPGGRAAVPGRPAPARPERPVRLPPRARRRAGAALARRSFRRQRPWPSSSPS